MKFSGTAKQLTDILHSIADGVTVQDASGNLVFVNRAAAKMMGFNDPEQALRIGGPKIIAGFDFFNAQGHPIPVTSLPGRRALQGIEEPAMIVGYKSTAQQDIRWSSIKAMPIRGAGGQVEFAVNVFQDITQLKETEMQLREANERTTKLLEQALDFD